MAGRFDVRYERLAELLCTLECATARQLHALFFAKLVPTRQWNPRTKAPKQDAAISLRSTQARLKRLYDRGFLDTMSFAFGAGRLQTYFLSEHGRCYFASVERTTTRRKAPPTADDCRRAWVRGEFWAATAGPTSAVHCDQAVDGRRILGDACGELPSGALPYDIIWAREESGAAHLFLLLVDDRRKTPAQVVAELPVHRPGGRKIGVLVRPCDDGSVWNRAAKQWEPGARLRQLLALLAETPQYEPWNPKVYRELGVLRAK